MWTNKAATLVAALLCHTPGVEARACPSSHATRPKADLGAPKWPKRPLGASLLVYSGSSPQVTRPNLLQSRRPACALHLWARILCRASHPAYSAPSSRVSSMRSN